MSNYLSSFYTYVYVPEYVAAYMRCTYGGRILTLSEFSPYYTEISQNLVQNIKLSKKSFSNLSYTQRAVEIAKSKKDKSFITDDLAIPSPDKLSCLLAVYIPNYIYRKGGVDQPSKHYQLTRRGAQHFRNLADAEFWRELFKYMEYKKAHGYGGRNQKRAILEDFIRVHRIDMEYLETLYRHMSRNFNKIKTQTNLPNEACV